MKASKECVGRLRKRVSSYVIKESVSEPRNDEFTLESPSTRKVIKKKNWSDAGPDKIANFWWKKVDTLHEGVSKSIQAIANKPQDIPWWFTSGKTIPN